MYVMCHIQYVIFHTYVCGAIGRVCVCRYINTLAPVAREWGSRRRRWDSLQRARERESERERDGARERTCAREKEGGWVGGRKRQLKRERKKEAAFHISC